MWLADLPVAVVPLWQEMHVPLTELWSTLMTCDHAVVV
jgi:hypothetical protein